MRRSQIKVADAASYTINTFKRSTKLADRVSKARNDANEDRSRAARIRSHSPTRRFATLHGSDPRPLYPSSHECPDSVDSEFIRLIRRAQDTLDAAKPDIEAEEHLTAALSQIELQSDQILGEMGYVDTYTEPVVATKCWLSAPSTHDHVRREVSFYFSKNSVPFTPPATDDVSSSSCFSLVAWAETR